MMSLQAQLPPTLQLAVSVACKTSYSQYSLETNAYLIYLVITTVLCTVKSQHRSSFDMKSAKPTNVFQMLLTVRHHSPPPLQLGPNSQPASQPAINNPTPLQVGPNRHASIHQQPCFAPGSSLQSYIHPQPSLVP